MAIDRTGDPVSTKALLTGRHRRYSGVVPVPDWTPGKTLLSLYTVEAILGQGGTGTVYKVVREYDRRHFAVKTLHQDAICDLAMRRSFLRELRTWIDLPEHPYLNTCRFFRTIDHRLAVFSDYIDGGSLSEWIRRQRLLNVTDILDIAIQLAWALEIAHSHEVVHQDVKPRNVLITENRTVKLTDFGLSTACRTGGITIPADIFDSPPVTSPGLTLGYCSPEQATQQRIGFQTDIWSLGLTILEMFTGIRTWQFGFNAGYALERHLHYGPMTPFPAMPIQLAGILSRCFMMDPEDRWSSMTELIHELKQVYLYLTGRYYARALPESPRRQGGAALSYDRRSMLLGPWERPGYWSDTLSRAVQRTCRLPELDDAQVSLKAMALVDLELYQDLESFCDELPNHSARKIRCERAELMRQKGVILSFINDSTGAMQAFQNSIAGYEEEFRETQETDTLLALVNTMKCLAVLHAHTGRFSAGIELFQAAIQRLNEVPDWRTDPGSVTMMMKLLSNMAVTFTAARQFKQASTAFDEALRIAAMLEDLQAKTDQAMALGGIYFNRARVMLELGDKSGALASLDTAREIFEDLVRNRNMRAVKHGLANIYMHMANCMMSDRFEVEVILYYDMAADLFREMIQEEGKLEFTGVLADVYMNKGIYLKQTGNRSQCFIWMNNAIEIWEKLVHDQGQTHFTEKLAGVYRNKGNALVHFGDPGAALTWYDRAFWICCRVMGGRKNCCSADQIVRTKIGKTSALIDLGRHDAAIMEIRDARELIGHFPSHPWSPLETALSGLQGRIPLEQ